MFGCVQIFETLGTMLESVHLTKKNLHPVHPGKPARKFLDNLDVGRGDRSLK